MEAWENFLIHLLAVPAIFLMGRLSAVKTVGFRIKSRKVDVQPVHAEKGKTEI